MNFEHKSKVGHRKRHRKRKTIYYNPPLGIAAKQNLAKLIFELFHKYYPTEHPFS